MEACPFIIFPKSLLARFDSSRAKKFIYLKFISACKIVFDPSTNIASSATISVRDTSERFEGRIDLKITSSLVGFASLDTTLNASVPTVPKSITPIKSNKPKKTEAGTIKYIFFLSPGLIKENVLLASSNDFFKALLFTAAQLG